ncbi:hypothetical protein [Rhizobium ruizarguesonis]|uniref:hypothetical protein n=1 Tax=Rhizobium ruizarguesonis TaxID=2081791 RepID=UPI003720EE7F
MNKDDPTIEQVKRAADVLRKTSTGLLLTGRIRDGKLELDKETLQEIEKRFPNADRAFVAMNSPFDPVSQCV